MTIQAARKQHDQDELRVLPESGPNINVEASIKSAVDAKGLKRRKVKSTPAWRLRWPSDPKEQRELFAFWAQIASVRLNKAAVSFQTFSAVIRAFHFRDGSVKRTNQELAAMAGGCSARTVQRHLDAYEGLGLLAFKRGWRRSKDKARGGPKHLVETREIVLAVPSELDDSDLPPRVIDALLDEHLHDTGGHMNVAADGHANGSENRHHHDTAGRSTLLEDSSESLEKLESSGDQSPESSSLHKALGRSRIGEAGLKPADARHAATSTDESHAPLTERARRQRQSPTTAHDISGAPLPDGAARPRNLSNGGTDAA